MTFFCPLLITSDTFLHCVLFEQTPSFPIAKCFMGNSLHCHRTHAWARLYFRGITLKYCGADTNFIPVKLLPAKKGEKSGFNISSTFLTKLPQQGLSSIKETRICQDNPFPGAAKEDISGLNKTSRLAQTLAPFSLSP